MDVGVARNSIARNLKLNILCNPVANVAGQTRVGATPTLAKLPGSRTDIVT